MDFFAVRTGRRRWACAAVLWLFQMIMTVNLSTSVSALDPNATSRKMYGEGYCSMYGICGKRSDGKALNCPDASLSVKPDDLLSSKIQSLCPGITGNVCCTADQFEVLRTQVQQAIPFLVGCPACLRNFLNIFCELSCSPNQSLFINVTSLMKVNKTMTVDGIDYFISPKFLEELYNSCKDVKFGTMNTRAMDFIGAGAQNYKDWLAFIGRRSDPGDIGSPFAINFRFTVPDGSPAKPMNAHAYSCSDSSLGCSCGDCPSAAVCSDQIPSTPLSKGTCHIKMGYFKVNCLNFSLAIIYVFLVFSLVVWAFMLRRRPKSVSSSRTNPLFTEGVQSEARAAGNLEYLSSPIENRRFGEAGNPEKMLENAMMRESEQPKEPAPCEPRKILNSSHPASEQHQRLEYLRLNFTQRHLSKFFRSYGSLIARNPTIILCCSLAIPLLFSLGLIRFRIETRPEKLWVAPGSKTAGEKEFFDHHLAPFYRIEQLILTTVLEQNNGKKSGIVTDENIKLLFEIQNKVDGLRANYSGTAVSLSDICLKPLGQACAAQSILQYFKMDPENYDDRGGVAHAEYCFEHFSSAEKCLSAFGAPLDPFTVLGGFSGKNFSEATSFVITYPVNNAIDKTGNENGKSLAWESAFIRLVKDEILPMVKMRNLSISFSSESSVQEELKRESTADVITIMISYIVMFTYISFALGGVPHSFSIFISSKVFLGFAGVLIVIISIVGSVGFFSAIGVKSTLIIMEVIPFLVLAVGVDNMCILVHAVKRQPCALSLEGRISSALAEVGPSITLASISEVLAFAVGSFVPMPACRAFSMFAALAVFLDFLLQITAFVSLITFDFRRAEDNRVDCFPCIKVTCTDMEPPKDPNKRNLGRLRDLIKEVYSVLLSHLIVKVVLLGVFIGFTLASIALCTRIQPGLEQQIVLPKDSYLQDYFSDLAKYLRVGPPLYFVVKDYNYSLESNNTNLLCSISQCNPGSLLNEISRASLSPESTYIAKPAASWLDDFLVWISPEAFGCCRKFTNGSYCPPVDQPPCCSGDRSSCNLEGICKDCTTCFHHSDLKNSRPSTVQFKEKLPWFLNALPSASCAKGGHGAYTTSIDLNGYENGSIRASAFRTYHTPLNKQIDYVNSMREAKDFSTRLSNSLKIEIFPYSVFYIFFEQYLEIWKTAAIQISVGLGAVFVVCLVITGSLWMSAIILLVLGMIIVNLMGTMGILNIQLNAISVVNLVMSIGIAVEFCVHITHAFSISRGDRVQRAREAIWTMGASVFSGITMTKLVGVIVLSFARSKIFVVYYFQIYLALVLIGSLLGLVFLPVLLSICGPLQSISFRRALHKTTKNPQTDPR